MFQFDKEYKLYNLAEALSLEDYDDIEEPVVDRHNDISSDIIDVNPFDDFAKLRLIGNNDTPLSPMEQILVKNVNNDSIGEYDALVSVADEAELVSVLQHGVKYFGYDGNYNWIDTSRVKKFVNLFALAFGNDVSKFNGDISKWDVSSVTNMMYTFKGCQSLTCDISNWDTKNVKFWSSASFAETNSTFMKICRQLKFPNKTLRTL